MGVRRDGAGSTKWARCRAPVSCAAAGSTKAWGRARRVRLNLESTPVDGCAGGVARRYEGGRAGGVCGDDTITERDWSMILRQLRLKGQLSTGECEGRGARACLFGAK